MAIQPFAAKELQKGQMATLRYNVRARTRREGVSA